MKENHCCEETFGRPLCLNLCIIIEIEEWPLITLLTFLHTKKGGFINRLLYFILFSSANQFPASLSFLCLFNMQIAFSSAK